MSHGYLQGMCIWCKLFPYNFLFSECVYVLLFSWKMSDGTDLFIKGVSRGRPTGKRSVAPCSLGCCWGMWVEKAPTARGTHAPLEGPAQRVTGRWGPGTEPVHDQLPFPYLLTFQCPSFLGLYH